MTYPSKEDKYIIMDEDITIGCPQHGGFLSTPDEHLKGYGCPNCRHEDIIKKLKETFKDLNISGGWIDEAWEGAGSFRDI